MVLIGHAVLGNRHCFKLRRRAQQLIGWDLLELVHICRVEIELLQQPFLVSEGRDHVEYELTKGSLKP